jgi:hypothetical protein
MLCLKQLQHGGSSMLFRTAQLPQLLPHIWRGLLQTQQQQQQQHNRRDTPSNSWLMLWLM